MNLKNLKRILQPGNVLAATDISPDDKKQLYKVMQKKGATDSFSYTRYFRDGFDSWEIDGVVALKTAFLEWLQTKEKIFLEVRNVGGSRWRHFYRIPPAPAEGQDFTEHDLTSRSQATSGGSLETSATASASESLWQSGA